jgi:hypothetical protein
MRPAARRRSRAGPAGRSCARRTRTAATGGRCCRGGRSARRWPAPRGDLRIPPRGKVRKEVVLDLVAQVAAHGVEQLAAADVGRAQELPHTPLSTGLLAGEPAPLSWTPQPAAQCGERCPCGPLRFSSAASRSGHGGSSCTACAPGSPPSGTSSVRTPSTTWPSTRSQGDELVALVFGHGRFLRPLSRDTSNSSMGTGSKSSGRGGREDG